MPFVLLLLVVAILFSVFTAMVFFGHLFIYWSIKKFFNIDDKEKKKWLAATLILLAVSFPAASVLAHWSENVVTRVIYFLASLWLGIALNLDIMLGIGWLLLVGGYFLKKEISQKFLGIVCLSAALLFSAYGVWNAYHFRIKEIAVEIKNLPASWQNKKVVQICDLHLGHVFGKKFLSRVVSRVNEVKPEAVFITGDLFDGMDGNLADYVEPLNDVAAPSGIYFVTGNHETYLGVDKVYGTLAKTKVKILNDTSVDIDGLQILGVSFPEKSETKDIETVVKNMANFNQDKASILLYHSPFEVARARRSGVSLMLSGHSHDGQAFPFGLLTKIIFHGYDYGLHKKGDFTIYTSSGLGTWGPTMRTFSRPEIVLITLKNRL